MIGLRLLSVLVVAAFGVRAQTFPVDTLLFNGDAGERINLVFLSDGYQAAELTKYISDANDLISAIFSQTPFQQYKSYFNVFAIKVPSENSGATHPRTSADSDCEDVPELQVDTYFGSTFDYGGIHRLLVPTRTGRIASVLAANFPLYDQVFVLVNSPYYGGSGGSYATSSTHTSAHEVSIHEIGHSFSGLADEYWAGAGYAAERPNMTQTGDPSSVKWTAWIGSPGIGVYPYEESPVWFRPHQSCKMRYLGNPFCSVCTEAFVERIHNLVNPLLSYEPQNLSLQVDDEPIEFSVSFLKPSPNSMSVIWQRDGETFLVNQESASIPASSFNRMETIISATITDVTQLSRSTTHSASHTYVVEWTVTNPNADPVTGLEIGVEVRTYEVNVFPNPVRDQFTLSYSLPRQSNVKAVVHDAGGRRVRTLFKAVQVAGEHTYHYPSDVFPRAGLYTIVLTVDQTVEVRRIIRID